MLFFKKNDCSRIKLCQTVYICDIILKAESWLVLNLPVFVLVYIHFNVPPTRITDLVRNVSDEKIYWYGTVTFVYVFASANLVVFSQLYSCTANEYSIYHFCIMINEIMIKDFSICFWRVIIVQDFETVLFVYKPSFSVVFCWMKRMRHPIHFHSQTFSLVRGYIEVMINKHEIWSALIQLTLRCLKYIKGIFNLYAVWHSYFLIPRQSFCGKRAKSLEKIFFPALKMQFGWFYWNIRK